MALAMGLIPIVAWTILLGALIYWYFTKNFGYWRKRGIPYGQTTILLGSMFELFKKPMHDVEIERYKELGRIYGTFEGSRPVLTVAEPDLIRDILIKDFSVFSWRRSFNTGDETIDKMLSLVNGEDWKRIRTIISPTFSSGKLKRVINIFKDCSETVMENFRNSYRGDEVVDVKRLFGAFTMDVIASSAFSTKLDSHNDPDNKFVSTARYTFTQNTPWILVVFTCFPKLLKLFNMPMKALLPQPLTFFKEVTLHIIEQRKKTGETRSDFLQLLLDTTKELNVEETTNKEESDDIVKNYEYEDKVKEIRTENITYQKKGLNTNELIAQCIIFFLAGYETTASTISFATYLLALHPEIQDKVVKEINETLQETDGELTYDLLKKMKYLDNVISETLRYFPPGIRLERSATRDYTITCTVAGTKKEIEIPKGMIVGVPTIAIHRDPEFYPEPEKFDPDRFTDENRATRNPFTYLPFGHGPRNCVAMRFALLEVKVCLAYALSHFKFKRCAETKVPLDYYKGQALLVPKEMKLRIEERNDCIKAH